MRLPLAIRRMALYRAIQRALYREAVLLLFTGYGFTVGSFVGAWLHYRIAHRAVIHRHWMLRSVEQHSDQRSQAE